MRRYFRTSPATVALIWVFFISYGAASVGFFIWNTWLGVAWVVLTGIGFYIWAGEYFDEQR